MMRAPYVEDEKPAGASKAAFWIWFDSLAKSDRDWANVAANGDEFRWRVQVLLSKHPPGVDGKARP
jgi:hypothetical protein